MKKGFISNIGKKTVVSMLMATLLLTGCRSGYDDNEAVTPPVTESVSSETFSETINETEEVIVTERPWMDESLPATKRVELLLSVMTLEEKAYQMVQPEQANITLEDVTKYGIGSVLSGGGSAPSSGNNPEDWDENSKNFLEASLKSRLGIPLLYGVDAVHGHNNVYGTTIFPHNIALGAANDEELMAEIASVTAKEVLATGITWDFSPCLGNPQDVTWGRTYECFSENTDDIARLTESYVKSLSDNGLIACAKHYIGEGYTEDGINQGDVKMSDEDFDELLHSGVLEPYIAAIEAGALTVMPSYNSVNGVKCHENYHLLTEILKDELGFSGFVISDYNAIEQCSGSTLKAQVAQSVNAGVDMLMQVSTWDLCAQYIIELVNEGEISEERIDDAVSRILYVKFVSGLFEKETVLHYDLISEIGSDEHRNVARRAVRESLVLLKNDPVNGESVFDILRNAKGITFAGTASNDMGRQCGGWTITWQGLSGKVTKGTTIISGCDKLTGSEVTKWLSKDGSFSEESDAIVAVFGEMPYAETDGDREDNVVITANDVKMLNNLKENISNSDKDIPVVGIILAGRPVDISDYYDMFDVIIMAWLPGTEGTGVADVLFDDYDFNGHLTMAWNAGNINFEYGYGLTK